MANNWNETIQGLFEEERQERAMSKGSPSKPIKRADAAKKSVAKIKKAKRKIVPMWTVADVNAKLLTLYDVAAPLDGNVTKTMARDAKIDLLFKAGEWVKFRELVQVEFGVDIHRKNIPTTNKRTTWGDVAYYIAEKLRNSKQLSELQIFDDSGKRTKRKAGVGVTHYEGPDGKIRVIELMPTAKPHIDDVTMAFHQFQTSCNTARLRFGVRDQQGWQGGVDAAQNDLRLTLTKLGLADKIDWIRRPE